MVEQEPSVRTSSGGAPRWWSSWWYATKRSWYRGGRPGRVARALNRAAAWQYAHGVLTFGGRGVTLEVDREGRRPLRLPLVLARWEGERYLVSMLGEQARWVAHVRAADGRARLVGRRGVEPVLLEDVPVASRAPVLRRYLQVAPGARPHVGVPLDAPLSAFEAVAPHHPVLRVLPAPAPGQAPHRPAEGVEARGRRLR